MSFQTWWVERLINCKMTGWKSSDPTASRFELFKFQLKFLKERVYIWAIYTHLWAKVFINPNPPNSQTPFPPFPTLKRKRRIILAFKQLQEAIDAMLTVGYLFRHLKWAKSTLGQLEVCVNPYRLKKKVIDVYIYIVKNLASYVEDIAWINTYMFLKFLVILPWIKWKKKQQTISSESNHWKTTQKTQRSTMSTEL